MQISRRHLIKLAGSFSGGMMLGAPQVVFGQPDATLTVALGEIPGQLDPLRYQTNPGYRVMVNIYDTLLTIDYAGEGALQPGLAESWRRIDETTLELTLRAGVKFHDGSPMTADDVAFSFSEARIADPETPGYGTAQQFLSTIAGVEVVDDLTVRIMTSDPDPALEKRLTAWGGQIIPRTAFEAAGWDGFAQSPVGTGPFRLVSMTPETITLEAFPDYWGGAPDISSLVYRAVPELSSRIAGLQSGDYALIADVPVDQFGAITRADDLEIVGGPIASIRVVKFDTRNDTLQDVRIRKAIGLAVDRQAIVDALWGGRVDVPNGHQLRSYGDLYLPDRPEYAYDPDRARALLAEAGYDGTPIPYRIRVGAYGPELATAQVLVAMWEAVGLNIDMQIKENFGQMMEYPGTGMRNGVDPVLVSDPLFGLWRSYNESEREVWENEDFYAAGHVFETSLDVEARKEALTRMLDIFESDPPAVILHTMGLFYGKRKDVTWQPVPHVYMSFDKAAV